MSTTRHRMTSRVSRGLPRGAQAADSGVTFFQEARRLPTLPLGAVGQHLHPQRLGIGRVLMDEPATRKDTASQISMQKHVGNDRTLHRQGVLQLRRKERTCRPARARAAFGPPSCALALLPASPPELPPMQRAAGGTASCMGGPTHPKYRSSLWRDPCRLLQGIVRARQRVACHRI